MTHANRKRYLAYEDLNLQTSTYSRLKDLDSEEWLEAQHFDVATMTCPLTVLLRFKRGQLFRIAHALRAHKHEDNWPTSKMSTEALATAIASHTYAMYYQQVHDRAIPISVERRDQETWGMIAWQEEKPTHIPGIDESVAAARAKKRKAKAIKKKIDTLAAESSVETVEAVLDLTAEKQKEKDMAAKKKAKEKKAKKKKAPVKGKAKAKAKAAPAKEKEKKSRKKSGLDYAADALKRAGKPLNAKEITERAIAAGWKTNGVTPHATLYAAIIREIAKKKSQARFRKEARGTFTFVG